MSKYIVTQMIQSADIDNNEPVQVKWYSGDSLAQAICAMTQAAAHHEEINDSGIPESARYSVLGVTLSIEQEIKPRLLPGEWDCESEAYALSDCKHWDTPGTECSGPRVGLVPSDGVILCEGHYNSKP